MRVMKTFTHNFGSALARSVKTHYCNANEFLFPEKLQLTRNSTKFIDNFKLLDEVGSRDERSLNFVSFFDQKTYIKRGEGLITNLNI